MTHSKGRFTDPERTRGSDVFEGAANAEAPSSGVDSASSGKGRFTDGDYTDGFTEHSTSADDPDHGDEGVHCQL